MPYRACRNPFILSRALALMTHAERTASRVCQKEMFTTHLRRNVYRSFAPPDGGMKGDLPVLRWQCHIHGFPLVASRARRLTVTVAKVQRRFPSPMGGCRRRHSARHSPWGEINSSDARPSRISSRSDCLREVTHGSLSTSIYLSLSTRSYAPSSCSFDFCNVICAPRIG